VEDDPSVIKTWILPTGAVLCVDLRFTDWLGKTPADCVGRPFISLGVEPVRAGEGAAGPAHRLPPRPAGERPTRSSALARRPPPLLPPDRPSHTCPRS